MRRQDSNLRPSGYEPDELPTAPLRDVEFLPPKKLFGSSGDSAGYEPDELPTAPLRDIELLF